VPHVPGHAFVQVVAVSRLRPQARVVVPVNGPLSFEQDPVSYVMLW
jgi:hypothetical protein